jgi:hypothetical protein
VSLTVLIAGGSLLLAGAACLLLCLPVAEARRPLAASGVSFVVLGLAVMSEAATPVMVLLRDLRARIPWTGELSGVLVPGALLALALAALCAIRFLNRGRRPHGCTGVILLSAAGAVGVFLLDLSSLDAAEALLRSRIGPLKAIGWIWAGLAMVVVGACLALLARRKAPLTP